MSYESAMEELKELGIVPDCEIENNTVVNNKEAELIDNIEKIVNTELSEEQKKILMYHGNMVILACAGSGKTTTLTLLIAKRILTGEIKDTRRLICTTYSKGGALEMEDRLHKILKLFNMDRELKVVTLHAFFLSIIRTFGLSMNVVDESDRLRMIREACKEADFDLKDDDLATLSNLISYQVNNLMSDKKALDSEANSLETLTLEKYTTIRRGYAQRKLSKNVIDFDDMQMYLYKWIVKDKMSDNENERQSAINVRNYCKAMWNDFYVDEAQDVSKIQYAILKEMITDPNDKNTLDKNFVFIGDDDQCIYKWRGADPSIILNISNTYDMKIFMLSTNYRCCENIVNFAANSVKNNKARYDKSMKAFNKGGNIKIAISKKTDLNSLSIIAFNYIKDLLNKGEKPRDICVMARNNFHLAILSNMLLHEGIYTSSTEDMKLTNSSMYKDIKLILNICKDNYDVSITRQLLWKLCKYMSVANSNAIASFQDSVGLNLKDTLGYLLKYFDKRSYIDLGRNIKVPIQAEEAMRIRWSKLSRETIENVYCLYELLRDNNDTNKIVGVFSMYRENAGSLLYKREDKRRSLNGLCNYIYLLVNKYGYDSTMEFLRITEQYETGLMYVNDEKITLTTVHSAKGKEWKNVIAFACDNVTMPGKEDIEIMLSKDADIHDINSYIEEERRLYYVEMTRAKENLLIITYDKPSVFIMESLGAVIGENKGTNYELIRALSSGVYVKEEAFNKLFDMNFIYDKILNKDSEYFYDLGGNNSEGKENK